MNIYESLDFSYNWNRSKLDCNIFTTVRLPHNRFYANAKKTVYLKKKMYSNIVILEVVICRLDQIKPWIKMMDVGYENVADFDNIIKTMYKNKNIDWSTQLLSVMICKTIEWFPKQ